MKDRQNLCKKNSQNKLNTVYYAVNLYIEILSSTNIGVNKNTAKVSFSKFPSTVRGQKLVPTHMTKKFPIFFIHISVFKQMI